MAIDLTGIINRNEYYTNHYLAAIFEENVKETTESWKTAGERTPWARLREAKRSWYAARESVLRGRQDEQKFHLIQSLALAYLAALGFPEIRPAMIGLSEKSAVPVLLEMKQANGAPWLWVCLADDISDDETGNIGILNARPFAVMEDGARFQEGEDADLEALAAKIFFGKDEAPRFLILIGLNSIALLDRLKWGEKRCLIFDLEEIFGRWVESTFKAMTVLLHRESLMPVDGKILLDQLDDSSRRHAAGVSQDLKFAIRECIELLGNEVLYDMKHRLGREPEITEELSDALTLECLRWMYRILFIFFLEARPNLGYAPIGEQTYLTGYSLESLREIVDALGENREDVGEGFYLHETLSMLFSLIYGGYPKSESEWVEYAFKGTSIFEMFIMTPLKAHIFDPERTPMLNAAKLRNSALLRIVELMSLTRTDAKKKQKRGRISYANLGINQLGAVYEALLSYRGFIAKEDLYEVRKAGEQINELDVGYFVTAEELEKYTEEERVYDEKEFGKRLKVYPKGSFIYRLAGREREKSASYYTPEVLTQCLVRYTLKELLEGKTADEILQLTICEPAMGSAAFLNEAVNQIADAYLERKEAELGETVPAERRAHELQKIKMYIADRNVYGIDLNPVAVELAEVSLWLNSIHEGGFVPWFGTQLVHGNSLIGARRQVYAEECLTDSKKLWYARTPERVALSSKGRCGKRIYHFLLGDPGMSVYSDRVIKSLEPEKIKRINEWRQGFCAPFKEGSSELAMLHTLSEAVDELWKHQRNLRKIIEKNTRDALYIFGQPQSEIFCGTSSIREKDCILERQYKTENARYASSYARLKMAMDYWCALWFWPIEQAHLLPERAAFMQDMYLILKGVLREEEQEQFMIDMGESETNVRLELKEQCRVDGVVDLEQLCTLLPRLKLVREIAKKNSFLHWELEFADIFEDRGGFDLIIGNPPWVKVEWNEQGVLADCDPTFAVKKLTAAQTARRREDALRNEETRKLYFSEYESMSGLQSFLNAFQNYPLLKGQQTNLFKCFLPQAWLFGNGNGMSGFVHPDGVYDDPKGGPLRETLYPKLRYHFQFQNEKKLFAEVDHHTIFSLNIYGNRLTEYFDSISNLFLAETVEQCYDASRCFQTLPGLKDKTGWCTKGHPQRVVRVGQKELALFAKLFDGSTNWKQARLPVLHAQPLLEVLECFAKQEKTLGDLGENVYSTEMWHETNAQKDGTIQRDVHFPGSARDMIYSGPHIGVGNPFFKTSRRICKVNSDYDPIDLTQLPEEMFQRCNYSPACEMAEYLRRIPRNAQDRSYAENYRLLARKMLNLAGERTLMPAIVPPQTGHTNALIGFDFSNLMDLVSASGLTSSIPFDFLIKASGKGNLYTDNASKLPLLPYDSRLAVRALLLNCLTRAYAPLWSESFREAFRQDGWSKKDARLRPERFSELCGEWSWEVPLRTDFERRQALVEIDVLTALGLGMTLEQLQTIYRIQFPVLQDYESETFYDTSGRIVFTTNRSLTGVGVERAVWEKEVRHLQPGEQWSRTVTDDTLPNGPVERTITYTAPFTSCSREDDYVQAWAYFSSSEKQTDAVNKE